MKSVNKIRSVSIEKALKINKKTQTMLNQLEGVMNSGLIFPESLLIAGNDQKALSQLRE
jgi:hypothetical protein